MRTFNALDGHHGRNFDTTDADDIMDAVGTIAFACGVDDAVFDHVIGAARDF